MMIFSRSPVFLKSIMNIRWQLLLRKEFSVLPNYEVNLKVKGTSLNGYIKKIEREFEQLTKDQTNNQRKAELQYIMQILSDRKFVIDNIHNLKELLDEKDDDIRKLAEDERSMYEKELENLNKKLIHSLVPVDKENLCNAIVLEVQAGVGGQEAMLFAKEIFDMYMKFANYKGWETELSDYGETETGGIRFASALVNGASVFQYFKHEAGVHRVQRIPVTEKGGRVHTSTISVIALPQPTDIQININPNDLKVETKRSSGAGGQHVNKTESAVRLVHIPTGVAVECQVDRSQIKNRKLALAKLKAILYQRDLESQASQIESAKKSQVKTRNRNEKIRTYNFNQDRVTDHRLGLTLHNLKGFLDGGETLEQLILKLDEHYSTENLLQMIESNS